MEADSVSEGPVAMEVQAVSEAAGAMEVKFEDETYESKVVRRRRNKLLRKIRQQMEFYFGDSNLAKDKFLREQLGEDLSGFVDVDLFLKFHKIQALTRDIQDIVDAVLQSQIFEVSSDGKQLRRKNAVERTNFDDCTIYVERLPPHADHKYLRDVFVRFGNVMHTSVPHFRASGKIKGFAFVEFESPECVVEACKHFKTSADSGESDTGEESDDLKDRKSSGRTKKSQGHHKDHQPAKGKDGAAHQSGRKRRRTESEGSERLGAHRRSLENEDMNGKCAKQSAEVECKNGVPDTTQSTSELESCDEKGEVKAAGAKEQHPEAVESKSDIMSPHKSGKKRKRRDTDNESIIKKVKHELTSGDGSDVQVCSSSESKAPTDAKDKSGAKIKEGVKRSTSDDKSEASVVISCVTVENDQEQRVAVDVSTKMETELPEGDSTLSKRQKRRRRKKKNKPDDDKPHLRVLTKAQWRSYRNKYLSLQRASMVHVKKMLYLENQHSLHEENADLDEDNYEQSPVKEDTTRHRSGFEIQPGVIIKLKLPEPVENSLKLRKKLKSLADVSYVEATEGCSEVYVRCPSKEVVSAIIEEARFAELGDTEVLGEAEETAYWSKATADRDAAFKRKPKHKKRGREKLIAKAAKMMGMNSHVHFDD